MPKPFCRRNLPHLERECKPHFLTFCAYQRWTLPESARTIVMETCMRANQWTIDPRAVVVMLDHVHMIFTPYQILREQKYSCLAGITRAIKGSSAHLINRQLGRLGRVWQEESFNRVSRFREA